MDTTREVISSGRVKCDACSEENKSFVSATEYCEDCDENLCDNCVRAHRKVKLAKSHRLVPLQKYNDSASKKDNGSVSKRDDDSASKKRSDSASNKDDDSATGEENNLATEQDYDSTSEKANDSESMKDNDSATGKDHDSVSDNDDDSATEQGNDSESESSSTSDTRYCESHKDQVVNLFCEECEICVCEACVAAEHKSHRLRDFNEVSSKLRDQISGKVTELEKALMVVKQYTKKATKKQTTLERKLTQNKVKIQQRCQEVRNLIDSFEAELLNEVESCMEADISKNRKKNEEAKYRSAQIQSFVRFLVALKENGDNEEVVFNGKELLTRAEQLVMPVRELSSIKCRSTGVDFILSKDEIIKKNLIGRIAGGSVHTVDTETKVLKENAKYNPKDFNLSPKGARFFIIKSFTDEGVQQSIKRGIWGSTEYGNMMLDQAYKEQVGKGPLYLFISVISSGYFCGMAQMMSVVDYKQKLSDSANPWGTFDVKWIYVKDMPNDELHHINLENNEGMPVANLCYNNEIPGGEIPREKGLKVLRIMHKYKHSSTILDRLQEDLAKEVSLGEDCENNMGKEDDTTSKSLQDFNMSTPEPQAMSPDPYMPQYYRGLPYNHTGQHQITMPSQFGFRPAVQQPLQAAPLQCRFNHYRQFMQGPPSQLYPTGQPMPGAPIQYRFHPARLPLLVTRPQYRFPTAGLPMPGLVQQCQVNPSVQPVLVASPQWEVNPGVRNINIKSSEVQTQPYQQVKSDKFPEKDEWIESVDCSKEDKLFEKSVKESSSAKMKVGRLKTEEERIAELKEQMEQLNIERKSPNQSVNLYVKNLDKTIDDDFLRKEFAKFGTIVSAKVMTNENGTSKCHGFISYETPDEAARAVIEMNGRILVSKALYVGVAQRKAERKAMLAQQHLPRSSGLCNPPKTSNSLQKQMLGERLFAIISNMYYPDLAGKITGMLLELDNNELTHMLETKEYLEAKVGEAVAFLLN